MIPAALAHVRVMLLSVIQVTFTRNFPPRCYKNMLLPHSGFSSFAWLEIIITAALWMRHEVCVACCSVIGQFNQFKKSPVPFFGLVWLLFCSSLSSLSSRSLQRRTCSSLIFKNRILFCSSLRASSTAGSTHMSSRILASILLLFPGHQRRPSAPLSLRPAGRVSAVGYDRSFFLLHLESGSLFFEGCGIRYCIIARGHSSVRCQMLCFCSAGACQALWRSRCSVPVINRIWRWLLWFGETEKEREIISAVLLCTPASNPVLAGKTQ